VRQHLGARGEPVAAQLESLDRLRYGRRAAARPSPAWWRQFSNAVATTRPR
jgi:hypothetical protein